MHHFTFLYYIFTLILCVASTSILFSIYLRTRSTLLKTYISYFSMITFSLFCGVFIIYFAIIVPNSHKDILHISGGLLATLSFSIFFVFQLNFLITLYYHSFKKALKAIKIIFPVSIMATATYVLIFIPNLETKRIILFANIALLNILELLLGVYNILNWKTLKKRIEEKIVRKFALIISIILAAFPFFFFLNMLLFDKEIYRHYRPLFPATLLNIWSSLNIFYSVKYFQHTYTIETKVLSDDFLKRYSITEREKDIIELVTQGLSNKEIAEKLCLSLNTIKSYMYNIFQKTEVKSRSALISLMKKLQ